MILKSLKYISAFFVCLSFCLPSGYGQTDLLERHTQTTMRKIGHEVLLSIGDSTSRVLPILKIEDQYKIQFEKPFAFEPSALVATIEQVMDEIVMTDGYLVEVENCENNEIVYSFEVRILKNIDITPCGGRMLPEDCYNLLVSILNEDPNVPPSMVNNVLPADGAVIEQKRSNVLTLSLIAIPLLLIGGLGVSEWKKRRKPQFNSNMMAIGSFRFDQPNMELWLAEEKTELTSKEADLLFLLFNAANTTVDRETILKEVWGDEGDYVGRTLDVYISKLRKKLDADSSVKIVNIRGVGYKLVVNNPN